MEHESTSWVKRFEDYFNGASVQSKDMARAVQAIPTAVTIVVIVGLGAALAGFIDGIVLWAKRTVKGCPNGTFFPNGTTDFNCYAHPRAGEGIAISAISLTAGAILLLLAYLSVALSRGKSA